VGRMVDTIRRTTLKEGSASALGSSQTLNRRRASKRLMSSDQIIRHELRKEERANDIRLVRTLPVAL
jgi:hypothetical protein